MTGYRHSPGIVNGMAASPVIALSAFQTEGPPAKVVAQRLGRNRGTVESWVQRFNADGLDGLGPEFRGQPGTLLHWLRRVDDQTSSRSAQTLCP
jgi:transposase